MHVWLIICSTYKVAIHYVIAMLSFSVTIASCMIMPTQWVRYSVIGVVMNVNSVMIGLTTLSAVIINYYIL